MTSKPADNSVVRSEDRRRRRVFFALLAVLSVPALISFAVAIAASEDVPTLALALAGIDLAILAVAGWRAFGPDVEPSRATGSPDPIAEPVGSDAPTEARIRAALGRFERIPADDIRLLAVTPLDPTAHALARATAIEAADQAGRLETIRDVEPAIIDWLEHTFGNRSFDPTFAGLAWRIEPLRPEDRPLLVSTIADALLAVATADLVDDVTRDELLGPCAGIVADPGSPPEDGS